MSDWTPTTKAGAAEVLRGASEVFGSGVLQPPRVDRQKAIDAVAGDVDLFKSRRDPDVRQIVIKDLIGDLRQKEGTSQVPDHRFPPQYHETVRADAAQLFDAETRQTEKSIAERLKAIRAETEASIERSRVLRAEAERIDPNVNHLGWIQARLLDNETKREAAEWLKEHGHDEAAVLKRYEASDDRVDNAFVRMIEAREDIAVSTERAKDEAQALELVRSPLRRAIQARQEGRLSRFDRETLTALGALEDRFAFARGLANADDPDKVNAAMGALLRKAK